MRLLYQNNSPLAVYAIALEMLDHMEQRELDAPLTRWKAELSEANEALMERIRDRSEGIGLKDQSRALLGCVMSIRHLVKSCLYSSDAELVDHAKAVEQVLKRCVGFGRMCAASKMTWSAVIIRDLSTPEMMPHVEAIPELAGRLVLLDQAREDLAERSLEMIYATAAANERPHLQLVKKNVAQLVNKIVAYLEAMADVDAETYEPLLKLFRYILNEDAKARRRAIKRKRKKKQAQLAKQATQTVEMKLKEEGERGIADCNA